MNGVHYPDGLLPYATTKASLLSPVGPSVIPTLPACQRGSPSSLVTARDRTAAPCSGCGSSSCLLPQSSPITGCSNFLFLDWSLPSSLLPYSLLNLLLAPLLLIKYCFCSLDFVWHLSLSQFSIISVCSSSICLANSCSRVPLAPSGSSSSSCRRGM